MEANEFDQGQWYDEYYMPVDRATEKVVVSDLFNRLEEKKKMPRPPGVDMSKPSGPPLSNVKAEYPKAVYNLDGKMLIVRNAEEIPEAEAAGYYTRNALRKLQRKDILEVKIPEKEDELAELLAEYKTLTGKDYVPKKSLAIEIEE